MTMDHPTQVSVEDVARRLATPEVVGATVARISRGRRRRGAAAAFGGLLAIAVVAFGGWAITHRPPTVPDPAAPPIEITDKPLERQLRDAVESGDHPRIEALIEAGAYVDQEYRDDAGGRSNDLGLVNLGALALRNCDLETLRMLDDAGASRSLNPLFRGDPVLRAAIAYCDVATVDAVLAGSDGSLTEKDIAKAAADTGSLELMAALADRGYPLENPATGWSTLEDAASEGRTDMVLLLLDLGADPTIWHNGYPLTDWLRDIQAPQAAVDAVAEAATRWEAAR